MTGSYRADIDGLRAIAILSVLFYHFGIGPFSGGYLGVDVFFVISGYLITGILLREVRGGDFSIMRFYERRIRRIIPALAVVMAASFVAGWFLMLPNEFLRFGRNIIACVFFAANFLNWRQAIGYFDPSLTRDPLMHFWSLAVEEQFYFAWPLLLPMLVALPRRYLLPVAIAVLALLSLVCGWVVTTFYNPPASFFLLPTRAWEILAGALLATGSMKIRDASTATWLHVVGMMAVLAAVTLSDETDQFPAWNALLAVAGTLLLLFTGRTVGNGSASLLGSSLPVFFGKISYSLYLWHWPLLVFARLYNGAEPSPEVRIGLMLLAVLLGVLSWRFVEQPFRRVAPSVHGFWRMLGVSVVVGLLLSMGGAAAWRGRGLDFRVPPSVRQLEADAGEIGLNRPCLATYQVFVSPQGNACVFPASATGGKAVIWGDSFADALTGGMREFVSSRGLALQELAHASCPPLPGLSLTYTNGRRDPACTQQNARNMEYATQDDGIKLVVLHAIWPFYVDELRIGTGQRAASREEALRLMRGSLNQLVDRLVAAKAPVLIVGAVPSFPDSPLHCLGRNRLFGRPDGACAVIPRQEADAQFALTDPIFREIAIRHPQVRIFEPRDVLCDQKVCRAMADSRLLYRDRYHLSAPGAQLVGKAMNAALQGWPDAR